MKEYGPYLSVGAKMEVEKKKMVGYSGPLHIYKYIGVMCCCATYSWVQIIEHII